MLDFLLQMACFIAGYFGIDFLYFWVKKYCLDDVFLKDIDYGLNWQAEYLTKKYGGNSNDK